MCEPSHTELPSVYEGNSVILASTSQELCFGYNNNETIVLVNKPNGFCIYFLYK